MYDRRPRLLTQPADSTAPNVGPGTYATFIRDKNNYGSYAPFQTMSLRESFLTISEGVAAAPGPGHYLPITKSSNVSGGSSLNNRSVRFHSPKSITPGPGAYKISSEIVQKNISGPNKDSGRKVGHVNFQRKSTAPSIPTPGLSYGYEEDCDGNLKPQELPYADGTLGPAYYDLSNNMDPIATRKYKGVHFGTLTSDRTLFKSCEGPGPGDYSPSVGKILHKDISHSLPNVPRYHDLIAKNEQLKGVPGPGKYNIKSEFSSSNMSDDFQKAPFGSHLQRFIEEKQKSPACTTYQDPRTAFSSMHRLYGMKKTPFSQTSKRFKASPDLNLLPGPGAYNNSHITSMSSQVLKRAMLNGMRHSFDSTAPRTAPLINKGALFVPSPTHYYQGSKQGSHGGKSYPFASTSKRLHSTITDAPPPGSYNISDNIQDKVGYNKMSGFLSTSKRFAPPHDVFIEEPDACNPGPGHYEGSSFKKIPGGICTKQPRFVPVNNATPGPGSYSMARSYTDTLLQGTFNATLHNPLDDNKRSMNNVLHRQNSTLITLT